MTLPYHYSATPDRRTLLFVVGLIWAALAVALLVLDAAWWIVALLGAFTIPAMNDLVVNPRAEFGLTDSHINWQTPRSEAEIALEGVDHLRLDTRLDFSVRLSVVLTSGRKLRVPVPATPPADRIEAAATEAGLKVRRHHFSLIG
ncbi:hypothetical protein ABMC89_05855 [Sulfitobacter sp. HNIBRBA3233]|uniref:hypothetical protein n=1 Tax=Sulfitobacter marinivivus TaxID=3158558 RepID=UPI0032DF13F8